MSVAETPGGRTQMVLWDLAEGPGGAGATHLGSGQTGESGLSRPAQAVRRFLREARVRFEPEDRSHFPDLGKILSSTDAYATLRSLWEWDREALVSLFLSSRYEVIGYEISGVGGIDRCSVMTNGLLRTAVHCGASGVIVAHNHPSGDPEPSAADRDITERLRDGCALLELRLLDHVIIGRDRHFSFGDSTDILNVKGKSAKRTVRRNIHER